MSETNETAIELDEAIDTMLRGPSGPTQAHEGELVATARLLRDALPRLHPRFSFEEHLSARLASARRLADGLATSHEPTPIRPGLVTAAAGAGEGEHEAVGAAHRRLGLVAGGAIASGVSIAGVSIAGAAIVAWRRSRSGGLF